MTEVMEEPQSIMLDPESWSPKQAHYMENSYHNINVATGAVQSGKSWIINIRFGYYVLFESPHDKFLICGNTKLTVESNVIDNGLQRFFEEILGKKNVKYRQGEFLKVFLPNGQVKTMYIVGVNNEDATSKLKGKPVGGSLLDEITTYPETPADMAFARNSRPGALVFCSTNPASKNHWAWKKYVGNEKKQKSGLVRVFQFTLDDNPTLDEDRRNYYRNNFEGVFYQRNILGLWVMAEGAIYDMFDEIANTFNILPYAEDEYDHNCISIDYGTGSVTTFADWYIKRHERNNEYHCAKEWYYDSREDGNKRLADETMVQELWKFVGSKWQDILYYFVDPSAVSLIQAMYEFVPTPEEWIEVMGEHTPYPDVDPRPFKNVVGAVNAVGPGIGRMSTLIGSLAMKWHRDCVNTIREYQGYVWDDHARLLGEEKPKKIDDHTPDRDRYLVMTYEHFFKDYKKDRVKHSLTSANGRILGGKYETGGNNVSRNNGEVRQTSIRRISI